MHKNREKGFLALFAIALAFAAMLAALLANISFATTSPANVVASANVAYTLYTSTTPTSLNLGYVYPNSVIPTNNLITAQDINGNIEGNVFVEGTNFVNGSNLIGASNTLWSAASSTTYTGTPLTTSFANTNIAIPAPTQSATTQNGLIYFGFAIPGGTPAGLYTETITFQNENLTYSVNALTTASVSVTANVQKTCYISLSANAINFGNIYAGSNTPYTSNIISDYDNGGNVPANILVEGTNWNEVSPVTGNTFSVSYTHWATANTLYGSATALSNTLADTAIEIPAPTQSTPTTSNSIYLGLGIPGGVPAGTYQQTITIENSC